MNFIKVIELVPYIRKITEMYYNTKYEYLKNGIIDWKAKANEKLR